MAPVNIDTLKPNQIMNFYGTYDLKYKGFCIKPDEITYFDIPIDKMLMDGEEVDSLYDMDKVKTRDKYSMFLYGIILTL